VTDERLDEIKTKWNIPVTLPMSVPWGKDDVVWLVGEVTRLRAEAKRADEEATKLANSDLATTEQVIRALRVENAALRAKVRTITEHYKPGWVDGLKAVARSAGFDPDDAPHDGVDPPTFIEDVIDLLRRDVREARKQLDALRWQVEHEGCAASHLGETTYECRADAPCGLCRLRAERDRLRAALHDVMGACDAECAGCGAYYVAKRALDGEKEKP